MTACILVNVKPRPQAERIDPGIVWLDFSDKNLNLDVVSLYYAIMKNCNISTWNINGIWSLHHLLLHVRNTHNDRTNTSMIIFANPNPQSRLNFLPIQEFQDLI